MAQSVDRTLLKAKINVKNGEFGLARALYRDILKAFPDNNRARRGLNALDAAVPQQPDEDKAQAQLDAVLALYRQGRLDDVIATGNALLRQFPNAVVLYNLLGVTYTDLGRPDAAIAQFDRALAIRPDFAEAHNNRGVALRTKGDIGAAIASYRRAIKTRPDYAQAHNNLGNAQKLQGDLAAAIKSYKTALGIRPAYAEAHNNLGIAKKDDGDLPGAIERYRRAIAIRPEYAEAHNNLGIALKDAGDVAGALASYTRALDIKPDFVDAHCNLCEVYEKQNNLAALEDALDAATRTCGDDSADIRYRLAQLETRKSRYDLALAHLEKMRIDKIKPAIKESYLSLLGKTHDRLDHFDAAFAAFGQQNALSKGSVRARKFNPDGYLDATRQMNAAWGTAPRPDWHMPEDQDTGPSPVFLVGFPRSGTTLLDSILRSHPQIDVLEEKPMVQAMRQVFAQPETAEGLTALSPQQILALRTAYMAELAHHADPSKGGAVIVDKLPLNIRHIGIIHRVFPRAKFILALRHPCDCVLSCYMQNFALNDAMANFLDLEQTATLYAAIMGLWSTYTEKLDLDVHLFRYEDLVRDLEGSCKPLIGFLGLDWNDNLKNFQKTALDRPDIATPSYNQVIQPLYSQASGRWLHYKKHLTPVLPLLDPWIGAFGYAR